MHGVSQAIKDLHVENCSKADPAYGAGVRHAIDSLEAPGTTSVRSEREMSK
jgi:catalase